MNVTTNPCLLLSLLTWFWLYCVLNCKPGFHLWFEDLTLIIMTTAIEWTLNIKNQVIVHNEPFVFFDICFSCLCVLNTHMNLVFCYCCLFVFPIVCLFPVFFSHHSLHYFFYLALSLCFPLSTPHCLSSLSFPCVPLFLVHFVRVPHQPKTGQVYWPSHLLISLNGQPYRQTSTDEPGFKPRAHRSQSLPWPRGHASSYNLSIFSKTYNYALP